ncbi:hypothetical protein BDV23DRAFT_163029 [Aspergillus alliaceus]|uniref:Uncharacterized protein n=1 Tax=Petromyces alliaceus TaxID=209559 RepID=A0A5N7BXK1_PETAA|nr:hypothetical protein BDV23DRAFT_163029 [Aspergillus alliaceus]
MLSILALIFSNRTLAFLFYPHTTERPQIAPQQFLVDLLHSLDIPTYSGYLPNVLHTWAVTGRYQLMGNNW